MSNWNKRRRRYNRMRKMTIQFMRNHGLGIIFDLLEGFNYEDE